MSRVTIFNIPDIYNSVRLSDSVVSLLNYQGDVLRSYRIGDAKDVPVFEISFVSYLGCFSDGGDRDLPYFAGEYSLNGRRSCIHLCLIAGYPFSGTQNSNTCWCGNSYGRYGIDINGCNLPCVGNEVETCGGPYRNSVYITSQSVVSYLGCFSDGGDISEGGHRELPYFAGEYSLNGQRSCIHLCLIAGYQFAGAQNSNQCWCGNSYGQYGVDLNGCNMPCVGNMVETCGGPYRNSVYITSQSGTIDATLVWRVRVQLDGRNYLQLGEVEVFDQNGHNRALNKLATQSSDMWFHGHGPLARAVDGRLDTISHFDINDGKYCSSSAAIFSTVINFGTSDFI